jgi:hypothetical protein
MQIPQRFVKLPVKVRQILAIGLGTLSYPAEDPIDGFPQCPGSGEHSCRRYWPPSSLPVEGMPPRRHQHAPLACPFDQIPVPIEPLNRLTTAAPAHRVGEVQAHGAIAQVERPWRVAPRRVVDGRRPSGAVADGRTPFPAGEFPPRAPRPSRAITMDGHLTPYTP